MAAGSGAIRAGLAYVELLLENKQFLAGLRDAQGRLLSTGQIVTSVGRMFQTAGTYMIAGAAAALAPLALTIAKASALEETLNKFNVVFGSNADVVKQWSIEFGAAMGRSREQVLSFMAGSQDLFVPLGFAADQATEMSKQVTQLAIDLASFNNMADADTLRDLHAALTGSGEVMKKYGVIVSEAAVKQELFNQGIDPKTATDQQKVMARFAIILRGTTAAQGDAERSAGSYANQMKALRARVDDAAAAIGSALLPTVTDFVADAAEIAQVVADWAANNSTLVLTVAKLAAGVLVLGGGLKVLGLAMTFLAAHPIVAAIAATAAGAIALQRILGDLTKVVIGLTAAWAVFTLNPTLLALSAVAAAAAYMADSLDGAADSTDKYVKAANDALTAGDKMRATTMSQFAELEKLAGKTNLTNEEQARARQIIDQLTAAYGDLGLRLDEATGKVVGLAGAHTAASKQMQEDARKEVRALIEASMARAQGLQAQMGLNLGERATSLIGSPGAQGRRDALQAQIDAEQATQRGLLARLGSLQSGDQAALTGAATEDPATAAARATDEQVKKGLELFHRQQQIRLGMIEDEHARALALIDEKYDHEIAMARAAGEEITGLEETRALEIAAANQKHQQDLAAEKRKALDEEIKKNLADDERLQSDRKRMGDEILRLEIENSGMTDAAKERTLLDLTHRREREEAIAAGTDIELVKQKQELEMQSLDRRQRAAAGLAEAQQQIGTSGTFSSFAAARMGGASSAAERTARATETQVDLLRSIDRKTVPQPAFT